MEIGVDSFVAATVDGSGWAVGPARHLSELLEAITLADEVGLDVFGIGEHHRREFLENAHRIGRAQDRDRARQADTTGSGRGGRENHRWRGIEELAPVVFADPKHIEPHLVSERDRFE